MDYVAGRPEDSHKYDWQRFAHKYISIFKKL
jgi:hypothetical protein